MYTFLFVVFLFALGVSVGSFLNVLIDRLPNGQKVIRSRSICPYCKTKLGYADLIPLFSFFYLKGRCRYCKRKIDRTLPLVEFITGVSFAAVFYLYGERLGFLDLIYLLLIICVLIVIFFMDLKYRIISDGVIVFGIVIAFLHLVYSTSYGLFSLYNSLDSDVLGRYLIKAGFFNNQLSYVLMPILLTFLASLTLFLFFYFLVIITKGRGMGGGDVKLAFLVGLISRWPNLLVSVILAFLTGALVSVILVLTGRKRIKGTVPFGPFLVLGTVLGVLFGDKMIGWYLGLM